MGSGFARRIVSGSGFKVQRYRNMKVESLAALSSRPKGSKLKGESRKKLMADS
jgi:hypothetical protein